MDNLSAAQRELYESMGKTSQTIEMFPEDTLAFITSQRLDLSYDVALETMGNISQETSDSIEDALQSVRDEIGIDLEDDLFHHLDGEFTLGIFPSSQGIWPSRRTWTGLRSPGGIKRHRRAGEYDGFFCRKTGR